ncbi:hypothetical protein OG874_07535 [Nocardia sp. NBC_00565]|uniref:hypothetical protein n=1 Tax=Nocardia sp. NBC_00565 TaxID=2975993 RepID=UPI002E815B50|nr:hypothetical protein [Nocardia sp. NBC_00565]WUC04999.1 hypothetical protein OG874_07535 [Nocardia sp. NBC_00565]
MTYALSSTESTFSGKSFLSATLDSAHRCPARSDYIELRFTSSAGSWQWCFPEPPHGADAEPRATESLALTFGRYGAQAHLIRDGALGPALPSPATLPMILAGTRIFVERRLVIPGWPTAGKGPAA